MRLTWTRALLLLLGAVAGYIGGVASSGSALAAGAGAAAGVAVALLIVMIEWWMSAYSPGSVAGGFLGLLIGLVAAKLLEAPVLALPVESARLMPVIVLALHLVTGCLGFLVGLRKGEDFPLRTGGKQPASEEKARKSSRERTNILDTSVIIDGRIADITETGFVDGHIVVPQFILKELQHIADSSDSLKRNRGRRGLDILQKIQKDPNLNVQVINKDFPHIREVDAKLVALGKEMNGKILTNDFNLNKVAELQGVTVLNINELANAMKPVVLPGEEMSVFVLKEGKEYGQGVAYLDDGTMVVVDNARKSIGRNVEVVVTSVLQTTAGRMIFTRLKEDMEQMTAS